jgi:hypothetical protein
MMRISLQNMGDSWREYVTFAAKFPTIHNIGIVVWDKDGPDWSPESNPVFMQAARMASLASQELVFAAADFSGVVMSQAKEKEKTEVKVALTVNVDKNGNVTATGSASELLASDAIGRNF